jgi:hypothetical protein
VTRAAAVVLLAVLGLCAACGQGANGQSDADPAQVDATAVPATHACRNLTRADVARTTNASPIVDCADPHNAETYAVGRLPAQFETADQGSPTLATWAYGRCADQLERHLGADQSVLMRSMLSWVWFGPSAKAWSAGARWYRCDLIGGGQAGASYVDLPTVTRDLLRGRNPDDRWMVCARGESVDNGKVPCSEKHSWRAVTTIKLGEPGDKYPGDAAVKSTTHDYCADSVDAWLGYPKNYDYAYTWFGEDEWNAGNRRSVCWAKTSQ